MRKLKFFFLALLALSLLTIPAAAQKGRSNKGGTTTGKARADLVQDNNKGGKKERKRKDHDSKPDRWEHGRHKGSTQGNHTAKGQR